VGEDRAQEVSGRHLFTDAGYDEWDGVEVGPRASISRYGNPNGIDSGVKKMGSERPKLIADFGIVHPKSHSSRQRGNFITLRLFARSCNSLNLKDPSPNIEPIPSRSSAVEG